MAAIITFFPVGNGDMTLLSLADANETKILVDCNIRNAADDPEDSTRHVAKDLRSRIKRDQNGRPYLDVFALSHPDQDHCNGLIDHFYLGAPEDYPDDFKEDAKKRILIREIWSSPMVFRRACKSHILCEDAKAFNTEAKRRVALNRAKGFEGVSAGDRILILGEDEDGKTDDLTPILVRVDDIFNRVNGIRSQGFSARLLAPIPKADDDTEEQLSKNHSSVILNFAIASDTTGTVVRQFLSAGDAEVAIWERLWEKHKYNPSVLAYDLMQTPHHNSWHSLSYDSWSEWHEKAQISQAALSALSQISHRGLIVSSSDPIYNDDNDPPCYGAKLIYEGIARNVGGSFYCTGEYPEIEDAAPLEFSVTANGLQLLPHRIKSQSLLRPAAVVGGLVFPSKPVMPNKSAGFA